jgi:hypothetical protein
MLSSYISTAQNYFERLTRHNCNQIINSVRRRGLAVQFLGRNPRIIYGLITVTSYQTFKIVLCDE